MSNKVSASTKVEVFTLLRNCWLTTLGLVLQAFISYSATLDVHIRLDTGIQKSKLALINTQTHI